MDISKELRKRAEEIAREHQVDKVFVNDQNEFFTQQSLALNSVGHDKSKLATVTVGSVEAETKPEGTGEATTAASSTTRTKAKTTVKAETAPPASEGAGGGSGTQSGVSSESNTGDSTTSGTTGSTADTGNGKGETTKPRSGGKSSTSTKK